MNNPTTTEIKSFPAHLVGAARKAVAQAQARIERAARKANQDAPAAPVLVVSEPRTMTTDDPEAFGGKRMHRVVDITVTYERPVLAGWEFLAVIEPMTGGNLLRGVPGATVADGELDAWRTSDLRCDHCDTIRRRSETFILRTFSGGENAYKQVGRQCLAHFLGGKSAAAIIASLAFERIIREIGEGDGGMSNGPELYDPSALLAQTAACVRVCGWVSKGQARDREGLEATADLVLFLVNPRPTHPQGAQRHREMSEKCAVTDADVAHATNALAWAKSLDGASDYERNLSLVAAQETIERSHVGILASAISGYNRHIGKLAEKASRPTSAHVGEVGKRIDLVVTVERTFNVDTDYGVLVINTMRTDEGAIVVWKTGKAVGTVGTRIALRGTVKRHSEYKGEAQTEMSRCAIDNPDKCEHKVTREICAQCNRKASAQL